VTGGAAFDLGPAERLAALANVLFYAERGAAVGYPRRLAIDLRSVLAERESFRQEVERLRGELEPYEGLVSTECPAHGDLYADTEGALFSCPFCRLAAVRRLCDEEPQVPYIVADHAAGPFRWGWRALAMHIDAVLADPQPVERARMADHPDPEEGMPR
jgi:hypothetical protein